MKVEPVIVERVYQAPVERVWQAITNVEKMRQWYFPALTEFEPEVGFETNVDVPHNGSIFRHIWKVTDVVINKKLSYQWKYSEYEGNSLVTFELFEQDGGTRIILTHDKLETFRGDIHPELAANNFVQGWTHFIGKALKNYVEQENED